MTFERFEVVRVPFPFTDRQAGRVRPALIISDTEQFNTPIGQSVLAMITSARHSAWPLDYEIQDLASSGLRAPSIVRLKLFTLDHRLILGVLGRLGAADRDAVQERLRRALALGGA